MPVHKWLLRHVYFPTLRLGLPRWASIILVFFVSAVFHEVNCGSFVQFPSAGSSNLSGVLIRQLPHVWGPKKRQAPGKTWHILAVSFVGFEHHLFELIRCE
eukprot:333509-Pelagomonas_calceolata.AAC.1